MEHFTYSCIMGNKEGRKVHTLNHQRSLILKTLVALTVHPFKWNYMVHALIARFSFIFIIENISQ